MTGSSARIPNAMNVLRAIDARAADITAHEFAPEEAWPLIKVVETKDMATAAHTWRVVLYARALSEALGLDEARIERVSVGAALHDVGKIDVPDAILKKPGRLTDDEFAEIRNHTVYGYDRLRRMGIEDPVVLNLVRWHHERLDGSGYPDGLKDQDIPPGPRYFAVVDTFDAMTSVRPYRREVGEAAAEKALAELRDKAGSWYCAQAVETFESLYRSGAITWILHYFNDECQLAPPGCDGR